MKLTPLLDRHVELRGALGAPLRDDLDHARRGLGAVQRGGRRPLMISMLSMSGGIEVVERR